MKKKIIKKGCAVFLLSGLLLNTLAGSGTYAEAAQKKPQLNHKKITLKVKQSAKLTVKKSWKKKVKKITFKSSKKKVASVSASGKIKAKKKGTAKITCRITLKNNKKYQLKCTVKVIAATKKKTPTATKAPTATVNIDPKVSPSAAPSASPSATPSAAPPAAPGEKVTPKPTQVPGEEHNSANGILTKDNGIVRADMTAFDLLHEMGIAINLGNTMESCGSWINSSSVSNYEKAWGAPITTQKMISGMKEAGFHSIRIPVAWSNMMSTDGKYTIHEAYLNRVEEIMNYALNEDMIVIVNIHYDSGWWAKFGSKDATERSEAMVKFKAMWTQIANRYKEYSDRLIFESANEELGGRLNSTDDYAGSGYYSTEDQLYELTNTINQTFVDVVRGTGGNNASRHLLIAGYNTDIGKTCDSRFHMPTDTIDNRLMISIHYYSPSTYCLAESESNSWGYSDTWGTEADMKAMKDELKTMKIIFADKGYPVVIGEYGVADTKKIVNNKETYIRKEGRDLFFQTLCEYALDNGMCPVLWSTPGHIYDRDTCQISHETERNNYKALEARAEENGIYQPESRDSNTFVWEGIIGCSGWNPTAPVPGENYNIFLNGLGGCYQITGVDWAKLKKPQLKLHSDNLEGSISYDIATSVNAGNQYYQYIDNAKMNGTWAAAKDITLDLSGLGLTGNDTLYICFKKSGNTFSGNLTLAITEK